MPGGLLSFGIYQKLGGEREFGAFWRVLGLPTIAIIAAGYILLVSKQAISQKAWALGSLALVVAMAAAVYVRALL
tara:strand:- start:3 stop:227 length:225 start_codon:yes stop_codon:yes gene_type:complete